MDDYSPHSFGLTISHLSLFFVSDFKEDSNFWLMEQDRGILSDQGNCMIPILVTAHSKRKIKSTSRNMELCEARLEVVGLKEDFGNKREKRNRCRCGTPPAARLRQNL